ncbi:hypothetical protein P3T23_009696, partial [Paraburkholderia sp. GAS448]|uniref:hypothetical protein n=1 Tax=Paraburkholderia sp. GAS448 TaxID=3035136 RepID=UPI003D1C0A86
LAKRCQLTRFRLCLQPSQAVFNIRNVSCDGPDHALLIFANLDESDRQHFLSSFNRFVLASPKSRHQLIEQWSRDLGQPTDGS